MDFKSLLSQLDQLTEAETKTTKTGLIHKGDYGREFDTDAEGNPVVKKEKSTEPKKRGAPVKADKPLTGKNDPKKKKVGDIFGRTTGDVPKGKKGTKVTPMKDADKVEKKAEKAKKSNLKDWIEQINKGMLAEAEQIQIKPASQMPKTPGQTAGASSQPGQQQVAGQPPKNTQVIAQGNKTLGTVDNPQLANQIKQSIGKGEMTLMPGEEMAEDGSYSAKDARAGKDIGKPGKNFAKIVKSSGGGEKGKRIAGAVLAKLRGKTNEADIPPNDSLASPLSMEESKKPDANKNGIPDYAEDGKGKNDLKKKKVKEGMDQHLQAARSEGKAHGLRGHAHCGKNYEDMEEARCYHEGYKEGLDECYGQMPIAGGSVVDEMGMPPATVSGMASQAMREPAMEDDMYEMDKTAYMKQQAMKTPGDTFKAFGQTFKDKEVVESPFAFESLEKQLNALLEGKEDVAEGMTVSISKGQQGAPDSVSVSAQDGEADQLLSLIKSAGLGLFGGEETNGYGAPQGSTQAPGGIEVVDDHDGMMALMKKLTGGEAGNGDYADEEGSEPAHSHEEGHEDSCNECGMAYESCGCDHGDKEVVDEVESEDQMTYNVAEDNPPDSGAADTDAEIADTQQANASAASYDQAEAEEEAASDKTVAEDDESGEDYSDLEDPEDPEAETDLTEWANEAGKDGTDAAFEADINFMTKVISGGLNKEKSTGQSTIPVVSSQLDRLHSHNTTDVNESVNDWKKLAGIK